MKYNFFYIFLIIATLIIKENATRSFDSDIICNEMTCYCKSGGNC